MDMSITNAYAPITNEWQDALQRESPEPWRTQVHMPASNHRSTGHVLDALPSRSRLYRQLPEVYLMHAPRWRTTISCSAWCSMTTALQS